MVQTTPTEPAARARRPDTGGGQAARPRTDGRGAAFVEFTVRECQDAIQIGLV